MHRLEWLQTARLQTVWINYPYGRIETYRAYFHTCDITFLPLPVRLFIPSKWQSLWHVTYIYGRRVLNIQIQTQTSGFFTHSNLTRHIKTPFNIKKQYRYTKTKQTLFILSVLPLCTIVIKLGHACIVDLSV